MISYAELEQLYEEAAKQPIPNIGITRTKEDADWLREMYPEQEDQNGTHIIRYPA